MLSANTADDGGPDARSCHKMVIDAKNKLLYVLGKYADVKEGQERPKSKMYSYSIAAGKWTCMCEDTEAAGGPDLIYDHQMCVDDANGVMYVFGGRKVPIGKALPPVHSGL
jgi:hypothetical protein